MMMKNIFVTYFLAIFVMAFVVGCSYPDEVASGPKVSIEDDTKVYATTIIVKGVVDPKGRQIVECGVCWKLKSYSSERPTREDSTVIADVVGDDGRFKVTIKGLKSSESYTANSYEVRAYALFEDGSVIYSYVYVASMSKNDDITSDKAYLVTVGDVVVGDFISSFVELNAGVTVADGVEVLERGFCWYNSSYSNDYTPEITNNKIVVEPLGTTTVLSATLKLKETGTYFIRAYVWTEYGVKYSANTTKYVFDEKTAMPQVAPLMVVSDLMSKSATFSASVDMSDFYGVTRRGFCWNTNATYKDPTIGDQTVVCDINSINEFSAKVTDLKSETYYKVRAFATNMFGISYSDKVEFYTLKYSTLPVLERMPVAVSKTTTSITVSNKVRDSDSGDAITDRGFCWSKTSRTPTMDDNVVKCGSGAGEYTGVIDGLEPSMFIYVRGYAVNRLGVAYSQDYLFTNTIYY